jgi:hypothetical protein
MVMSGISDMNAKILTLSMQARQHTATAIEQLVNIVQNTNSHAARLAAQRSKRPPPHR